MPHPTTRRTTRWTDRRAGWRRLLSPATGWVVRWTGRRCPTVSFGRIPLHHSHPGAASPAVLRPRRRVRVHNGVCPGRHDDIRRTLPVRIRHAPLPRRPPHLPRPVYPSAALHQTHSPGACATAVVPVVRLDLLSRLKAGDSRPSREVAFLTTPPLVRRCHLHASGPGHAARPPEPQEPTDSTSLPNPGCSSRHWHRHVPACHSVRSGRRVCSCG